MIMDDDGQKAAPYNSTLAGMTATGHLGHFTAAAPHTAPGSAEGLITAAVAVSDTTLPPETPRASVPVATAATAPLPSIMRSPNVVGLSGGDARLGQLLSEMSVMRRLDHPHVVKLQEARRRQGARRPLCTYNPPPSICGSRGATVWLHTAVSVWFAHK